MSDLVRAKIKEGELPPEKGSPGWVSLVRDIEAELGRRVCARKKNGNGPGKGWPCEGILSQHIEACRMHGGASPPPGPDHHAVVHGRYSRVLQGTSLQEMYNQARNDPDLLALNQEISLVVARQQRLMQQLATTGESRNAWRAATRSFGRLEEALHHGDLELACTVTEQLRALFEVGLGEHAIWTEWDMNTEQLRRLVDTERKYREGMQLNLSAERAMMMLTVFSTAARNVLPAEQAKLLLDEVRRLRGSSAPLLRAG